MKTVKIKIILAVVFAVCAVWGYYKYLDKYQKFTELCRSGSVEEVRSGIAGGAALNPELEPVDYLNIYPQFPVYVKTTHPDGITTYMNEEHDDSFVLRIKNTLFLFLFNYTDELPLHAAIRCNPDPQVGIELARAGARDSDGMIEKAFFLALQREVNASGILESANRQYIAYHRREGSRPAPGNAKIAAALMEASPRTMQDEVLLSFMFGNALELDDMEIYRAMFATEHVRNFFANNTLDMSASFCSTAARIGNSTAHPELVRLAASAGADFNLTAGNMPTPLGYALAKNKNPGIVQAILEAGADPNKNTPDPGEPYGVGWRAYSSCPPLILALIYGRGEEARALLAAGADPEGYVPGKIRKMAHDGSADKSAFEYALDYVSRFGDEGLCLEIYRAIPLQSDLERAKLSEERCAAALEALKMSKGKLP